MNIVLSIHHFLNKNAGAPGSVMTLGGAMRSAGNHVDVIGFDTMPSGFRKRFADLIFPLWLCYRFRKNSPSLDVIDSSTGDSWLYSLLRSQKNNPLLVTHSHGLEHILHKKLIADVKRGKQVISWKYPLYSGGLRLWLVAQSLRGADLCLFLNQSDLNYAVEKLRVKRSRCRLIANGVEDYLLDNQPNIQPVLDKGALNIVQLGEYINRKGTVYGAAALNPFLKRHPNVRIDFIGTRCPKEEVLRDFDQSVHSQIVIIPRFDREELGSLLENRHVLLFPSLSEGFPLAMGEGMACGLAPIASNIPGVIEIVTDGLDGILVPPADAMAIERALEELMYNPDKLYNLRTAARQRALGFRWSKIAGLRLEIYREFIAQKREH